MSQQFKPWQKGYELEYLKHLEGKFSEYNRVCLSPFAQIKKNKIAELLDKNQLSIGFSDYTKEPVFFIPTRISKTNTPVKMLNGIILGIKQKGERTIDNPTCDNGHIEDLMSRIKGYAENCWFFANVDYVLGNVVAEQTGFKKIGVKISSFADITNVYCKRNNDNEMIINRIPPLAKVNITKLNVDIPKETMQNFKKKLDNIMEKFANHYSNYNKNKSWSAISLRGFSNDFRMIEKPAEMNDKWKEKHKNDEYFIQDTELMQYFEPWISNVLKQIPVTDYRFERIRFMKLEPKGGELDRHTDQTDEEMGINDGDLVRLHIPITTNDKVIFSSWDHEGKEIKANMKEGELWYLDIRKPHKAINGGDKARIHLVIDVRLTEELRKLIVNIGNNDKM